MLFNDRYLLLFASVISRVSICYALPIARSAFSRPVCTSPHGAKVKRIIDTSFMVPCIDP